MHKTTSLLNYISRKTCVRITTSIYLAVFEYYSHTSACTVLHRLCRAHFLVLVSLIPMVVTLDIECASRVIKSSGTAPLALNSIGICHDP